MSANMMDLATPPAWAENTRFTIEDEALHFASRSVILDEDKLSASLERLDTSNSDGEIIPGATIVVIESLDEPGAIDLTISQARHFATMLPQLLALHDETGN